MQHDGVELEAWVSIEWVSVCSEEGFYMIPPAMATAWTTGSRSGEFTGWHLPVLDSYTLLVVQMVQGRALAAAI